MDPISNDLNTVQGSVSETPGDVSTGTNQNEASFTQPQQNAPISLDITAGDTTPAVSPPAGATIAPTQPAEIVIEASENSDPIDSADPINDTNPIDLSLPAVGDPAQEALSESDVSTAPEPMNSVSQDGDLSQVDLPGVHIPGVESQVNENQINDPLNA